MLVLFLMVSTPLSVAITATAEGSDEAPAITVLETSSLSEVERLELAASHWSAMPHASTVTTQLMASTGMIHLALGSFDPLLGGGPEVPATLVREHDASHTGMAIVQLHQPDGTVLSELVVKHDLTVLDVLHDEAWLVRLAENGKTSFADLRAEDAVRWVGQHQPGWRLAPSLLTQPASYKALAVVPTPDLGVGGYAVLATDMVQYGAVEASCDAWMCLAVVDATSARSLVHHLAHDGRVLWTEPTSELRVHNALAWSIAGVQNVANNATFTLDGSGEMIAIADTGLDRNHPDLTGRVAAT